MIAQIGVAKSATGFLETIRNNTEISKVVYCCSGRPAVPLRHHYNIPKLSTNPLITDQLDTKFADFHENEWNLGRWVSIASVPPLPVLLSALSLADLSSS